MSKLTCAVLIISDTCSRGENVDRSGPALLKLLSEKFSNVHIKTKIIPDDLETIKNNLVHYSDVELASLILTTGGTGFSDRDVTPEATRSVIHRETPGITTAMCMKSMESTPFAMLSRSVCGIRGKTLIINMPGSVKAATECFSYINMVLPHALDLINDELDLVKSTHANVQNKVTNSEVKSCVESSGAAHKCCHSRVDVSAVATRLRESPFPMIEVSQAAEIIYEKLLGYKQKIETCLLENVLGAVLAVDIVSPENFPPFPASIKDGYACLSSDGTISREVIGAVTAGEDPRMLLTSGKCVRINTGAPIPQGADCVVQVEDTKILKTSADGTQEFCISVECAPKPGQDIRPIGSDIKKMDLLLTRGTVIGPAEVGLLATVGLKEFSVYQKPCVSLLSTGNELQSVFSPQNDPLLKHGHIRDSNKPMFYGLLSELGVNYKDAGIAIDDPDIMKTAFENAFRIADFVITTGSVSMGDKDIVKRILTQDFSATLHFGRLNMKPGKPTTFATCIFEGKTKFIFALPGNPVSALVTSQLLVIPALKFCMGMKNTSSNMMQVILQEPVVLDSRPEYVRATVKFPENGVGLPLATPTGHQISSRLMSAAGAPLLLRLPSSQGGTRVLSKGSHVTALIVGKL